MIELFYFSGLDLMIKVEYAKEANSLRYASHREMANDERAMTEQYIMAVVAPKTEFHRKHPSMFVYLGADHRLKERLACFQKKRRLKASHRKEKEITASIHRLINASMRTYYTEKIGELIRSARNKLKHGRQYNAELPKLRAQMTDLVKAYNVYADHQVTLNQIIPSELRPYLTGAEEDHYDFAPSSH
jgi:DNA primase catalytic subunit